MSYDLNRFHKAQSADNWGYETAINEIKNGRKVGHWIWYIFPQLKELGRSSTAQYYGIDGIDEARAYFTDPVLSARLAEISQALAALAETDPIKILGHTDAMKVKSCMTLFLSVDPNNKTFQTVIDKFYGGKLDQLTIEALNKEISGTEPPAGKKD